MNKEAREIILGWALIGLSSIGVYTISKEIKDAYYKHRMLEHGKELEKLSKSIIELRKEGTENKEESQ